MVGKTGYKDLKIQIPYIEIHIKIHLPDLDLFKLNQNLNLFGSYQTNYLKRSYQKESGTLESRSLFEPDLNGGSRSFLGSVSTSANEESASEEGVPPPPPVRYACVRQRQSVGAVTVASVTSAAPCPTAPPSSLARINPG